MAENEVNLIVSADTKQAESAFDKLEQSAGRSTKEIESGFGGLSSTFKNLATAAVGVAGGFALISKSIAEAVESDKAIKSLSLAIAGTGEFSKKAVTELQAYADKLSELTGIDDDVVVSNLALAKSFGISNDQAKKLVTAATNLSAVTGQDLESSVRQLGGTFDGTIGKLANLGSEFRDLTKEQAENGAVLDLINSKYQDAGAALGVGFEGSLNRVQNAFADVFKAIGQQIINDPDIIDGLNLLATLLKNLASTAGVAARIITDAFKDTVSVVALASSTVTDSLSSLAKFVGLDSVSKSLDGVTDSAYKTVESMGAFGTLTKEVDTTLNDTLVKTSANSKGAFDKLGKAALEAAQKLEKAKDSAKKFIDGLIKSSGSELEVAAKKARENFDEVTRLRKKGLIGFEEAEEARAAIVSEINEKIDKINEEAFQKDKKRIKDINDELDRNAKEEQARQEKAAGLIAGIASSALAGGDQKKNIGSVVTSVASAFGPVIGAIGSVFSTIASLNKDQAKAFIKDFIEAAPDFVLAIVENIPAIIDGIVEALSNPKFWERAALAFGKAMILVFGGAAVLFGKAFIDITKRGIADAANAFAAVMGESFANFAQNFVDTFAGFFENIGPAIERAFIDIFGGLASAIFNGFTLGISSLVAAFSSIGATLSSAIRKPFQFFIDFLNNFRFKNPFGGGGGGDGVLSETFERGRKSIGLAKGGIVPMYAAGGAFVPRGTDTVPAMLTPGELVVPANKAEQFLNDRASEGQNTALLTAILQVLSQPMSVRSEVKVDQNAFADIILQLNRQNARLSA